MRSWSGDGERKRDSESAKDEPPFHFYSSLLHHRSFEVGATDLDAELTTPDEYATVPENCSHAPPPPGVAPPPLWGDEPTVQSRLNEGFADITVTRKFYPLWRYPFPVPDVIKCFARLFGPIKGALAKLDQNGQQSLIKGLEEIFSAHNLSQD